MMRKAPPPTLPLIGGGVLQWLTGIPTNSICPSPCQGEARWGSSATATHTQLVKD